MVEAVKQSFPQREIADASFALQTEIDSGRRIVVGVNAFRHSDETELPILRIDPALERKQIGRVQAVRTRRDTARVEGALGALRQAAAQEDVNLMPALLDAARSHATEGEIVRALQEVWGDYTETPVF
jgi:methylmalonyl-CoA mutase N-terminal domain/subunit